MLEAIVIGAGQAGLSAAYHLKRLGLVPEEDFIVLDSNNGPGGAWRHRWPSLTLGAAHNIHDLPGMPLGEPDPGEPASAVVCRYYQKYEREFGLPVHRPVSVSKVEPDVASGGFDATSGGDDGTSVRFDDGNDRATDAPLTVHTSAGTWQARSLINATGAWDRPYWPYYAGRDRFQGRQLHTHDFCSADEFRDQHVVVVGAGTSAVQFLLQLSKVATTTWVTRRPPEFTDRPFDAEWGRDIERRVRERTSAGLPPLSVVATTGLPLTPEYQKGIDDGVLVARRMFTSITEDSVVFDDGTEVKADAILWATGFRPSLDHLAPLHLREPGGGIRTDGVKVVKDPRMFLTGYGASASTLGANRAGRAAATAVMAQLNSSRSPLPSPAR
ncbi:NAD(P)-binding domain-containing protein [Arthrobacter sp. H14]|uniref:NAD(P)-binding domain-containing protein n=1 Tax=Arthrobacter sp. H14 TaxID=1312959 RepID=UPI00047D1049|nr:NAD(P)-binding domain-containing protein [Arthrobacter sp. H14]